MFEGEASSRNATGSKTTAKTSVSDLGSINENEFQVLIDLGAVVSVLTWIC